MGDKRNASKVILVRKGKETTRKIEVFDGELFPGRTFTDKLHRSLPDKREGYFRLRIDGKWFPEGAKILFSRRDLNTLLQELVSE